MVVYDVCKVVSGEFIGPFPKHFVVQGIGVHLHVAADEVVHLDNAVKGHLEADGPVRGGFQKALNFGFREAQGIAEAAAGGGVVHEGLTFGFGLRPACGKFIGAVKRVIGPALLYELLCVLAVEGLALALAVRGMGMFCRCFLNYLSVFHSFVGDDPAPVKGLYDVLLRSRHKAVGVGVLYTDNEISALLLGIEIVIQCRTHAAHVQRTGR